MLDFYNCSMNIDHIARPKSGQSVFMPCSSRYTTVSDSSAVYPYTTVNKSQYDNFEIKLTAMNVIVILLGYHIRY